MLLKNALVRLLSFEPYITTNGRVFPSQQFAKVSSALKTLNWVGDEYVGICRSNIIH